VFFCIMQGKKQYQPQIFLQFNLADYVPDSNFYRRLKEAIDWRFLYKVTGKYYGKEGNPSIDPVVFFKLILFGYLENIASNRKIIEHASMRLDIKYYLNYDLQETLPWHSTLSRTRQLYGEEVFKELFNQILQQCIEAGMVTGHTQAVDSAFIKANASMDSIDVKQPVIEAEDYLNTLVEDEAIHENENKQGKKHLANNRYFSPTDPDARISVKPGKVRQLNYLGQVSVDSCEHIITNACVDYADKRDSQSLETVIQQTRENLQQNGMEMLAVVADTNYSSGEAYGFLEEEGITGYIPVAGAFDKERTNSFQFDPVEQAFTCPNNKKIRLRKESTDKRGNRYRLFAATTADCKECPFRTSCLGKQKYKSMKLTAFWRQYQKMHDRMRTSEGKNMLQLRKSTVEHVLGTMIHFNRLRKVNERGIKMANKHMLLSAIAYNIKKLMNYTANQLKSGALSIELPKIASISSVITIYLQQSIGCQNQFYALAIAQ
jgi:transposase